MAALEPAHEIEQLRRASQTETLGKRTAFESRPKTIDGPILHIAAAAVVIVAQLAWLWLLFVGVSYLVNLG